MPPTRKSSRRPSSRGRAAGSSYVKFSDKLTDSLEDITAMINEHKEMIDTIQELSLELTATFSSLHTLTVKYAGKANQILDILLPILDKLPLVPAKAKKLLTDMERWTQKIIDNEKKTSKTLVDVRSGLESGNVSKLQAHKNDLQGLARSLTSILPAGK